MSNQNELGGQQRVTLKNENGLVIGTAVVAYHEETGYIVLEGVIRDKDMTRYMNATKVSGLSITGLDLPAPPED